MIQKGGPSALTRDGSYASTLVILASLLTRFIIPEMT